MYEMKLQDSAIHLSVQESKTEAEKIKKVAKLEEVKQRTSEKKQLINYRGKKKQQFEITKSERLTKEKANSFSQMQSRVNLLASSPVSPPDSYFGYDNAHRLRQNGRHFPTSVEGMNSLWLQSEKLAAEEALKSRAKVSRRRLKVKKIVISHFCFVL